MVVTYKNWHEMLPYALHGYRTSLQTSIRATPYSLVYGMRVTVSARGAPPACGGEFEVDGGTARRGIQSGRDLDGLDELIVGPNRGRLACTEASIG
ncbi:hypothetical protein CR513_04612, partial [Mucuna pruriens]